MMLRQEGNPELSATRGPAQEAEKIPGDGRGLAPAGAAAVPGFTGPAGLVTMLYNRPSGFPGGAVVENLPANAGDTGSSPGLGRSHMPRSNWAREPQLLSLRVWSLCSATREAAIGTRVRALVWEDPTCHGATRPVSHNY
ncbi:hypothetical protein J1605_023359 [Eschrichtius robustus]|uniref:Uncharacterized protein n=1 Tax=Eschrichtius robustus TaxID=9764 RepID=A0AB34H6L7_ESCRO|nr:hypothetical protein J1605_023359 [Eschrichtius robustus]